MAYKHRTSGNAVASSPICIELTTQQAADLLNVSRPFLVKLPEQGRMPFRKAGKRGPIRLNDLLMFTFRSSTDLSRRLGRRRSDAARRSRRFTRVWTGAARKRAARPFRIGHFASFTQSSTLGMESSLLFRLFRTQAQPSSQTMWQPEIAA